MEKMNVFDKQKEETVKVMTFQHKEVWDEILSNGEYRCVKKSNYQKATPECYKRIADTLDVKCKEGTIPIFGWSQLNISETKCGLDLDKDYIYYAQNKTGFPSNSYYGAILEVPLSYLAFQDFYNFVDCRCEEEGLDTFMFDPWNGTIITYPYPKAHKERDIQCIMPVIKKEWLRILFSYEEHKINGNQYNTEYSYEIIKEFK